MGLGFKSPLSYASSFIFSTRKNGIERTYLMHRGEEENEIRPISEKNTKERNGTKVIVSVKGSDIEEFHEKIRTQLAYFENVFFNVSVPSAISNDFYIIRDDDFQVSQYHDSDMLKLCLDNVVYDIDFEKLGISPINCPIALRFSLSDGIYPTPSRESIRYRKETVEKILKKIEVVSEKLSEIYINTLTKVDNFDTFREFFSKGEKFITLDGKAKVNVNDLVSFSGKTSITPVIKGAEDLNSRDLWNNIDVFIGSYYLEKSISKWNSRVNTEGRGFELSYMGRGPVIYLYSGKIPPIKLAHIKEQQRTTHIYFIRKKDSIPLFTSYKKTGYYDILNLKSVPRSEWRKRIEQCHVFEKMIEDKFPKLEDYVIPDAWINSKKATGNSAAFKSLTGRRKKEQGEIWGKYAKDLQIIVSGQNCKLVLEKVNIERDIYNRKSLMVYEHYDNWEKIDKIYPMLTKLGIAGIVFSEREIKKVNNIEATNLISYDDFMKGKARQFKRWVTAVRINELIGKYKNSFNNIGTIEAVKKDMAEAMDALSKYVEVNYRSCNSDVTTSSLALAEDKKLFDYNIYDKYEKVKKFLEENEIMNSSLSLLDSCGWRGSEMGKKSIEPLLVIMFKYKKVRVNINHYKLIEK